MLSRKAYNIKFEGLTRGLHHFNYRLDDKFFERHPYGMIKHADVKVEVEFDKQEGMFELLFKISGTVERPCDRCLEKLEVSIDNEVQLVVRLGEGEDETDLIYIPANSHEIDIEQFLYEFTSISVPMQVFCSEYSDQNCPQHILDMIVTSAQDLEKTDVERPNPFKDAFKDLKLDEEN